MPQRFDLIMCCSFIIEKKTSFFIGKNEVVKVRPSSSPLILARLEADLLHFEQKKENESKKEEEEVVRSILLLLGRSQID